MEADKPDADLDLPQLFSKLSETVRNKIMHSID